MSGLVPLLLLPGQLCDERLWRDPATALADVALPIFGDLSQDESIPAMAERALTNAPPEFALAGLSMGGYVALEIMRQAPERVLRLALLDTSARPESPARASLRYADMSTVGLGRFAGITPRLLPQFIHASRLDSPVAQDVMTMTERVGQEVYLRQQRAILARPDARPLLAGINVPTLVGVGDSDRTTPPRLAEEMQAAITGAKLHVFQNCGHLPPMEVPDETTQALRAWLS
ncbi:MAG TPA: alpha/beta fold hydrolase [Alphaproteobacteria bacterium]|jgi:pimeloyl-ACP methyl ester carboxylesterase